MPCSNVSHGLFRFSGSQVDRTLLHIKVWRRYKSPEWPCKARRDDPVSTASLTSPTDPTNAGTFLTVLTTDVRFEVPSQGRFIYCSSWLPPHRAIGYDVEERGSRLLRNTATFVSRLHAKIIVFKTSKPTHAICCLIQNERQSLNIFKKCQNFYTNWCTSF